MAEEAGLTIKVPEQYASSPSYVHAILAVESALRARNSINVNPDEIIVTGERERVCIIIVPHHQLGGVSLLTWSDMEGIQFSWGHVTTLGRHDDLDMSVRVGPRRAASDIESIASLLAAEMSRPIFVDPKFYGTGKVRLECSIEIDGRRQVIGRPRLTGLPAPTRETLTTSLAGKPLPFAAPVPIEELRRSA